MAYRMSYAFEGNFRNRPEQNLSGASKKHTRDTLLQRAHEERQKRQDQRLKLQSAELLQSYIRSYLTRKHKKYEERIFYEHNEQNMSFREKLARILFFYDSSKDKDKFLNLSNKLLAQKEQILTQLTSDSSFAWLIKRMLVIHLKVLPTNTSETVIKCLDIFTENLDVLSYLISKGYCHQLRLYLDASYSNVNAVVKLVHRPFQQLHLVNNSQKLLSEFVNNFLSPQITPNVKYNLIPFLRNAKKFPYHEIVQYLNRCSDYDTTNNLLYCMLALEPADYEHNLASIQVLSNLSINLHYMTDVINLTDDSDEEMDVCDEHVSLQEYIFLLNNQERVKKILLYFDDHSDNEELLLSLTHLCHNLLLLYKDSIRKFMLVYMLAIKGTFISKLWQFIIRHEASIIQSSTGQMACLQDVHMAISVFCDVFTFYTETLTDSESTDTSGTFTSLELGAMSELLKNVALNLIELAFPMCRSNSLKSTPEMIRLYNSCLNAVKMLYTLDLRKHFCKSGFWTKKKIHISTDLTRKNYLQKTVKPFHGLVDEDEGNEDHLPPLSTVEIRSLAILQQLPFLIDFNTRVLLLRSLCYYSLTEDIRLRQDFVPDSPISVRRTHLYEDAFDKLSQKNDMSLRHKLRIQFINSMGLEEAGIDGGGIFKEFINEVLKTAFDPNRGFFLLTAENTLYPNPNVHLIVENFAEHYYFIGRLVGKAIFENILVDLPLAEFFLAKLLIDRASAHYLESLDPILYRNLLYLRDYTGNVQDLGLDFTIVNNDLGETRIVELKPNGSNIPVTNYNRLEYIHRLADLKLNVQIKRQCVAFREGIDSVVPLLWLKLFNHNELQVIIGGDNQEMDITDLKINTVYAGDFTSEHPTIVLFWKILEKFTDTQKKQLLKFVTSCSRPPLLGFKELNPQFCIQSSGTEDRMPTASTCLNLLKIPIITNEEVLRKKLLSAIEQQAGFELS